MMAIKTHSAIRSNPSKAQSGEPHFHLNPINPLSTNVEVRKYPLRVIAWGLEEGESVTVWMARVSSIGNPHWTLSDDNECPCVLPPAQNGNVASMAYVRGGQPLVLTAESPCSHIDDAGVYYFEYHGNNEVILDHYDDPVSRKVF